MSLWFIPCRRSRFTLRCAGSRRLTEYIRSFDALRRVVVLVAFLNLCGLCGDELALSKRDAVLEFGLPVHHASNADYIVCTAQSIATATTQSIMPPSRTEGERHGRQCSLVIRGRHRMDSARPVYRYHEGSPLSGRRVFSPSTSMPPRTPRQARRRAGQL